MLKKSTHVGQCSVRSLGLLISNLGKGYQMRNPNLNFIRHILHLVQNDQPDTHQGNDDQEQSEHLSYQTAVVQQTYVSQK